MSNKPFTFLTRLRKNLAHIWDFSRCSLEAKLQIERCCGIVMDLHESAEQATVHEGTPITLYLPAYAAEQWRWVEAAPFILPGEDFFEPSDELRTFMTKRLADAAEHRVGYNHETGQWDQEEDQA